MLKLSSFQCKDNIKNWGIALYTLHKAIFILILFFFQSYHLHWCNTYRLPLWPVFQSIGQSFSQFVLNLKARKYENDGSHRGNKLAK